MPDPGSPGEQPQPSEAAPPALDEPSVGEAPPPETTTAREQSSPSSTITTVPVEVAPTPPPLEAVVAVPPSPAIDAHTDRPTPDRSHRRVSTRTDAVHDTDDDSSGSQLAVQVGLVSLTAVLIAAGFWPSRRSPYASLR